ncbi:hypothetical protein [Rhizobium straminoryzae]|uniref:Uncharacterized protein n=1 Tax=Rhizobium straminoryzae TaxID=1387186 RepID=A0A549TD21_9HYPH|nr:hypothetical protein [Rhizobium straminoryzae]TRL39826.1 hypothetical protein FNA46_07780 [Rhizobium straminoryzae]
MSFWYSDTSTERPTSIARGEASLGEIYSAATDQMRLVDNQTSAVEALTRAYDERIKAIQDATGESLPNPMRQATSSADRQYTELTAGSTVFMRDAAPELAQQKADEFSARLTEIANRYPEKAAIIGADRPVERDAEALARQADQRLGKALASRDGLRKWGALIAGGMVGSGYDPMQVGTWIIGGGPGGARTAAGRILQTVISEAAVNGLTEAIQQPQIQAWRKQAGLPNGPAEAMQNVAIAGLLGGALGGSFQAAGEGISRALRSIDPEAAVRALAEAPTASPELRAAVSGDTKAAADLLTPIRADLPAEARGALAAIDIDRMTADAKPASASAALHDSASTRAIAAAQTSTAFFHDPAPEQIARIVDQLIPPSTTSKTGAADTIDRFLMRAGGVQDYKGELKALGLENRSERFVGKLVREGGMPLDQARLRAAEAGYFNDLYGTAENAMEKSTIADLLDALDTASRDSTAIRADDGGRAYAESLVYDIAARAGPAVDDHLILKAAELANAENLPPAEALDRVLIADDAQRFAAEDEAAAGWNPADRTGGLDDPLGFPDEMSFSRRDIIGLDDDFEIPFFDDDRPVTGAVILDEIERLDHLTAVVEACRL